MSEKLQLVLNECCMSEQLQLVLLEESIAGGARPYVYGRTGGPVAANWRLNASNPRPSTLRDAALERKEVARISAPRTWVTPCHRPSNVLYRHPLLPAIRRPYMGSVGLGT